jgi:gluconolactonase
VIQINPETKEVLQTIQFPVTLVTSAVWGGENLDTLYVTTSRHRFTEDDILQQPLAGTVFKVTGLGVVGTLANNVKLPAIFK